MVEIEMFKNIYIRQDCVQELLIAQSTGAVEYTDCTSAEGLAPPPWVSCIWH